MVYNLILDYLLCGLVEERQSKKKNEKDSFVKSGSVASSLCPEISGILDGVPMYCRGPAAFFSGSKHHAKYLSFLVCCDVNGTPIQCSGPYSGRQHDSKCLRTTPLLPTPFGLEHRSAGLILADLAFIASPHCCTKYKKPPAGELTTRQKLFNKWHDMLRARVESLFARADQFKIMHFSQHRIDFNAKAAHFIFFSLNAEDGVLGKQRYEDVIKSDPRGEICHCGFLHQSNEERLAVKEWRDEVAKFLEENNYVPCMKKSAKRRRE